MSLMEKKHPEVAGEPKTVATGSRAAGSWDVAKEAVLHLNKAAKSACLLSKMWKKMVLLSL